MEEAAQSVSISAPFWHGAKLIIVLTRLNKLTYGTLPSHGPCYAVEYTPCAMAHTHEHADVVAVRPSPMLNMPFSVLWSFQAGRVHCLFSRTKKSNEARSCIWRGVELGAGNVWLKWGIKLQRSGNGRDTHACWATRKKISTGYMTG